MFSDLKRWMRNWGTRVTETSHVVVVVKIKVVLESKQVLVIDICTGPVVGVRSGPRGRRGRRAEAQEVTFFDSRRGR